MADGNSLGLELNPAAPETPQPGAAKEKPYVNPDRVSTGGPQRDKLSEDALAERMARIREQNERIKQRRLDVEADEEAFHKTQEQEKVKHVHNRKVQEDIDKAREQSAKRKMEKAPHREWDSGKPAVGLRRSGGGGEAAQTSEAPAGEGSRQWARGSSGRGRGGRGGGGRRGNTT